jgi:protein TonB
MRFFVVCYLLCQFSFFQAKENPTPQDKTAAQVPSVPRITVKSDAMEKKLVRKVIPIYPYEARRQFIAGTVILHILIGVDGNVKETKYVSGPDILVKPATDAVRQWKYKPTTQNGQPVEVDTTVESVFSLRQ